MTFAAEQADLSNFLFPLILVFGFGLIFYMSSRQRKKMAAQQAAMLTQLTPGTRIVLTSGIKGAVESVEGEDVRVEIAPGAVVTVLKQAVLRVENPRAGDDLIGSDDTAQVRDDEGPANPPHSPVKEN